MSRCGCNSNYDPCAPICPPTNSPRPATVVYAQNSWNIPALNDTAELDVPSVKAFLVGTYIWNPTYGKFKVTSFNAVTGKLVIENTGFVFNAVTGTVVPAYTAFQPTPPTFEKVGTYTPLMPTVGSMTFTVDAVTNASYEVSDGRLWVDLVLTFTPGGTPDDHAIVSLPYLSVDNDCVLSATLDNNDAHELVALSRITSGTHILIRRLNDANFALVQSFLKVSGSYKTLPI